MPFKGQKTYLELCFRNYYRYIQLKTYAGSQDTIKKNRRKPRLRFCRNQTYFHWSKNRFVCVWGGVLPSSPCIRQRAVWNTHILGLSGQSRGNALFQIHWTQVIYFDGCCHRFTDMQTLLPTKILGWQVCYTMYDVSDISLYHGQTWSN